MSVESGGRHMPGGVCNYQRGFDQLRLWSDLLLKEPRARAFIRPDDNGCWIWTGAKGNEYGHGMLTRNRVGYKAHRYLYELLIGPVPQGLELDHLCRVPPCVNPNHLEPVTHKENVHRGISFSATNHLKTHCPQGHPYSGDNLYVYEKTGQRQCRACNRVRVSKNYWAHKIGRKS